jgi:type III secretion protein T
MDIEALRTGFFEFTLILPRLLAAFSVIPFLGRQVMGGVLVRNGVVASFAVFLIPVMHEQLQGIRFDALQVCTIILKEVVIGLFIGYMVTLPFWAFEAAGFFIDNQRGATMASSLNPLSGAQTSLLGILLMQAINTVFFASGLFLLFLGGLYRSYLHWPVHAFFPTLAPAAVGFYLGQLDLLMRLTVIFSAPVIIAMFLTEFGLGLVSRFAPQLNVFFLSMPIKSAVGLFVLILYLGVMIGLFGQHLREVSLIFPQLDHLLK